MFPVGWVLQVTPPSGVGWQSSKTTPARAETGTQQQLTTSRAPERMGAAFALAAMYTDWTAIALLLFTAVPLLIVVATATYFVIQNDQKTPLG